MSSFSLAGSTDSVAPAAERDDRGVRGVGLHLDAFLGDIKHPGQNDGDGQADDGQ